MVAWALESKQSYGWRRGRPGARLGQTRWYAIASRAIPRIRTSGRGTRTPLGWAPRCTGTSAAETLSLVFSRRRLKKVTAHWKFQSIHAHLRKPAIDGLFYAANCCKTLLKSFFGVCRAENMYVRMDLRICGMCFLVNSIQACVEVFKCYADSFVSCPFFHPSTVAKITRSSRLFHIFALFHIVTILFLRCLVVSLQCEAAHNHHCFPSFYLW